MHVDDLDFMLVCCLEKVSLFGVQLSKPRIKLHVQGCRSVQCDGPPYQCRHVLYDDAPYHAPLV